MSRLPPRDNMPRRLAYADRWVWELTQTVDDYSCHTRLSESDETKLFSALLTGADLAYPEESHRLMRLMWQLLECQKRPRPRLPDMVTLDSEGNLRICMSGKIYIYQGCGCGCGDDTSGGSANTETGGTVAFPATLPPADCYASSAVEYLLDRAEAFHLRALQVATLGWDAVLGNWDEAIDTAALLAGILSNRVDLDSYREISQAFITNAFNDPAFIGRMQSAWDYEGQVSRTQLREWVDAAPFLAINGAPIQSWLWQWVNFSIIPRYNNRLAAIAESCLSGTSVPGPVTEVDPLAIVDEFVGATHTYRLRKIGQLEQKFFGEAAFGGGYNGTITLNGMGPVASEQIVGSMGLIELKPPFIAEGEDDGPWPNTTQLKQVSLGAFDAGDVGRAFALLSYTGGDLGDIASTRRLELRYNSATDPEIGSLMSSFEYDNTTPTVINADIPGAAWSSAGDGLFDGSVGVTRLLNNNTIIAGWWLITKVPNP